MAEIPVPLFVTSVKEPYCLQKSALCYCKMCPQYDKNHVKFNNFNAIENFQKLKHYKKMTSS